MDAGDPNKGLVCRGWVNWNGGELIGKVYLIGQFLNVSFKDTKFVF